ncbi:TetR/AcrR family transcriptional regulator [Streptomyces montanus]|uniref:TetR/AcrR family transcriptional regulator n=1 Tax=Streptomyces montanus TaxID=2580423 RepID=A0A5R9FMM2_9ACTN|nr:TetR/AcrR family transcriptional regulator [Streptomyces montanus]
MHTRAALVQAAAQVFAESGFAGASVAKIADRAGLTLGAIYFHFKNKESLAREIVRSQPEHVAPPLDSEGLQRAVDITLTWACRLMDDPILMAGARLVMDQQLFLDQTENSHDQWTRLLTEQFRIAQRRRELRASADVEVLAQVLVNACTGAQMHSQIESGYRDLPFRVEQIWQCFLPATAAPSAISRLQYGEARGRIKRSTLT